MSDQDNRKKIPKLPFTFHPAKLSPMCRLEIRHRAGSALHQFAPFCTISAKMLSQRPSKNVKMTVLNPAGWFPL